MRAKDFLSEATLEPRELFKLTYLDWRPINFLKKLQDLTIFVDPNGKEYVPDESEYERIAPIVMQTIANLKKDPNSKLPEISVKMQDGSTIPLRKLEKADLQTPRGQQTSKVNVQPIGIGIATDKAKKIKGKREELTTDQEIQRAFDSKKEISAGNLYSVIMNNQVLDDAGELGKAVKETATQIYNKKIPVITQYDPKVQNKLAIDAGEYLGILQMIYDTADFDKRQAFLDFLNATDFNNLSLIFPGEQNSPLSDSYGVQNKDTGHTILISSKGGKGSTAAGAAPSIKGLSKSIEKRKSKIRKGNALDFLNTIIQVSPTTAQGFAGMNWLNTYYPDAVPQKYKNLGILPFYGDDVRKILTNIKNNGVGELPPNFDKLIDTPGLQQSKATPGGKIAYVVTKDLINAINENDPIPNFKKTILELLDENFVQIFSRIVGGKLVAKVLWPGKVDGYVSLHTKMDPTEPGKQGMSFKVTD